MYFAPTSALLPRLYTYCLLYTSAVSVVFTSGALKEKVHYQYGADEQFVMSEDQNFVILLLDTVDSRTITELLDEHPEYSEVFRDFTYFENTVGAYSCTCLLYTSGKV